MLYDGDGRKIPKYAKDKTKEKNSGFGCPPIHPVYELEADCFRCPKIPKTSRTHPKW